MYFTYTPYFLLSYTNMYLLVLISYLIDQCMVMDHLKIHCFNLCDKVLKVCIRHWNNLVLLFLESHFYNSIIYNKQAKNPTMYMS